MSNIKNVFAASLVICGGLAAQSRLATYDRSLGNNEIGTSIILQASATHSYLLGNNNAVAKLINGAACTIGGVDQNGIEISAFSHASRSRYGVLAASNWNRVRRANFQIHSSTFGNSVFNQSFSAGTVTERNRIFAVGSYLVAATIRVSAGASINLRHTSVANRNVRAAYLLGRTRTYMDGSVWAVAGLYGATAHLYSILDLDDTAMEVSIYGTPNSIGGTISFALQTVRLYMRVNARRYWWQWFSSYVPVNIYVPTVYGSRRLL